ncbi:MAG: hypothetical protein AB1705_25845 [Verrucomicrobiota bacterium]
MKPDETTKAPGIWECEDRETGWKYHYRVAEKGDLTWLATLPPEKLCPPPPTLEGVVWRRLF